MRPKDGHIYPELKTSVLKVTMDAGTQTIQKVRQLPGHSFKSAKGNINVSMDKKLDKIL